MAQVPPERATYLALAGIPGTLPPGCPLFCGVAGVRRLAVWLRFLGRVVRNFRVNQGVLLAGAVAYYTLLSLLPMLVLIVLGLSQLVDRYPLLETTRAYVELIAPGESAALMAQLVLFLDHWEVVGLVGLAVLVVFSAMAFTVLENAMSVIFYHRVAIHRRHFLISALLPYLFIFFLALGLLAVSVGSTALAGGTGWQVEAFGTRWSLGWLYRGLVYLAGVAGEFCLLTALYLVMPVGRIAWRHAVLGGLTATVLWELTRHLLVWYFETLSYVNVIYGSLAGAVMILLSLDLAAMILLFGAQVIAEIERRPGRAGDGAGPSDAKTGLGT